MLTRTADYALRALLLLAQCAEGVRLSAEVIADRTGAPRNYMSKTLHVLARAGLLRAARGPSGGFRLAKSPSSLSIADIAALFAEPPASRQCLLGTGPCDRAAPCAAHFTWMAVARDANAPLENTTIADLLADATQGKDQPHAGNGRKAAAAQRGGY